MSEQRRAFHLHYPGLPIGKERPRFGRGRIYTPSKTRGFETALAWHAKIEMRNAPMLDGPLALTLVATLPTVATGKPDADNLLKSVCDALEKIVFKNDAQVVRAVVEKRQGKPGLVIAVRPL